MNISFLSIQQVIALIVLWAELALTVGGQETVPAQVPTKSFRSSLSKVNEASQVSAEETLSGETAGASSTGNESPVQEMPKAEALYQATPLSGVAVIEEKDDMSPADKLRLAAKRAGMLACLLIKLI